MGQRGRKASAVPTIIEQLTVRLSDELARKQAATSASDSVNSISDEPVPSATSRSFNAS